MERHLAPQDLAEGRLYALSHPFVLDGRVSTHARETRGYSAMQLYLMVEDGRALLVEGGLSVHEVAIRRQLERLIGPGVVLDLFPYRASELNGTCNVRAFADHFDVGILWGLHDANPAAWVDIRPDHGPTYNQGGGGALREVDEQRARIGESMPVGTAGRTLEVLVAPLRLLPTAWSYDAATKTLFTSEAFTWVWQGTPAGPWVITADDDDPVSPEQIREEMFRGKFWWLPGARTDELRRELAAVFETYEVETIAPSFGCVLHGSTVVERHYGILDTILAEAPDRPSVGVDAGRWYERPPAGAR